MKTALFTIVSLLCLSACGSINYVNIETHKPAGITFPAVVKKVLIVNNAVPQPEYIGYEYLLKGIEQDTARVKADSALFDACRALGLSILETGYFNDVLLFHEPTRTDDQPLSDERLTPETVSLLCEENDADAIISIDRLLFEMKKTVTEISPLSCIGVIDVKIDAVLRAYLPGPASPLAKVLMADSVYWAEEAESLVTLQRYLPDPETALREAGKYLGAKASPNFVPHWQNEIRWYYTGGTTAWKQASAYANAQRWKMAMNVWESIYNSTSAENAKAKSASNIAFSCEMQGDYGKALEWAEKSLLLFKKKGEDTKNYQLLYHYTNALRDRIQENRKLGIQFGEI